MLGLLHGDEVEPLAILDRGLREGDGEDEVEAEAEAEAAGEAAGEAGVEVKGEVRLAVAASSRSTGFGSLASL